MEQNPYSYSHFTSQRENNDFFNPSPQQPPLYTTNQANYNNDLSSQFQCMSLPNQFCSSPYSTPASYPSPGATGYTAQQYFPPPPPGYPENGVSSASHNYYNQLNAATYPPQPTVPQSNLFPPPSPYQNLGQQAPSQPSLLTNDGLPNPISVQKKDESSNAGLFNCSLRSTTPSPLSSTNYIADNIFCASPRYLRASSSAIPSSSDLAHLPMLLSIQAFSPLAPNENALTTVDFGDIGPVRCGRCKAYMSPFMRFIEGGCKFVCALCDSRSEVPSEYFNHLDSNGNRIDSNQRAELSCGSYEMLATPLYCRNNALPTSAPAYVFLIDVSYQSSSCGLVNFVCRELKEVLVALANKVYEDDSNKTEGNRNLMIPDVAIVTYNSSLHVYRFLENEANEFSIEVSCITELEEIFVPYPDGLLISVFKAVECFDLLASCIYNQFVNTKETQLILKPAIEFGFALLETGHRSGKLIVLHTSLPTANVSGKLSDRNQQSLLGSEQQKKLLLPHSDVYAKLVEKCTSLGCCVDFYICCGSDSFLDLATFGEISRLSNGSIKRYANFSFENDSARLLRDLKRDIVKEQVFDAVLKVRTCLGLRIEDYFGNFTLENGSDVVLPCITEDSAQLVQMKHDDKLNVGEDVFVQVVVLFTTFRGVRKLRVHNLSFSVTNLISDIFQLADHEVIVDYLLKNLIRETFSMSPKVAAENAFKITSQIFAAYRKHCSNKSSDGQLVLPEQLKLIPLYLSCLLKTEVFSTLGPHQMTTDQKSCILLTLRSLAFSSFHPLLYPKVIALHNLPAYENMDGEFNIFKSNLVIPLRPSFSRLEKHGVYAVFNALSILIWIGETCSQEFLENVFGVQSLLHLDTNNFHRFPYNPQNELNVKVNAVIQSLSKFGSFSSQPKVVLLCDLPSQKSFDVISCKNLMLEDAVPSDSKNAYIDFIRQLYSNINEILN